jgi:hypothetical protein
VIVKSIPSKYSAEQPFQRIAAPLRPIQILTLGFTNHLKRFARTCPFPRFVTWLYQPSAIIFNDNLELYRGVIWRSAYLASEHSKLMSPS